MQRVSLTDRQMQILREARAAKIAGTHDADVQTLIQAGYLETTRPGGAVAVLTARGLSAVADWLDGAGSPAAGAPQTVSAGHGSLTGDRIDDCEEYEPDIGEAQTLVDLLLKANPRRRLRGKKGNAIRELLAIKDRIAKWDTLTSEEKRQCVNRLWALNVGDGATVARYEILGAGRFPWREKGRPRGNTVDRSPGDREMIMEAKKIQAETDCSIGAALRNTVEKQASGAFNIDSAIKRLRRKMAKEL